MEKCHLYQQKYEQLVAVMKKSLPSDEWAIKNDFLSIQGNIYLIIYNNSMAYDNVVL